MPEGEELRFVRAGRDQAADVLGVLDETAAWLRARHIEQWPDRFELAWVQPGIDRGETWLVKRGDAVAGTVTLNWQDPVWSDVDGAAGYVHRLAVRRSESGLGAQVLRWTADRTAAHGRNLLRLDCVASNNRLCAYYEAAGFVHRGDVPVGGTPGQRLAAGRITVVSRYELRL